MRKVMLATPSMNGWNHAQYTFCYGETLKLNYIEGWDLDIRPFMPIANAVIPWARNDCLREMLTNGFDDIFFIDADEDFPPRAIKTFLDYPVDVVGAPVHKKVVSPPRFNVRVAGGPESIEVDPDTGLWTAPDMAIGTGFLRLSRRAVEALAEKAEPYEDGGRWICDVRPIDGIIHSEDTILCDSLRAVGIETWLDPTVSIGHYDGALSCYRGDFVDFCKRVKAEREEERRKAKPELKVVDKKPRPRTKAL